MNPIVPILLILIVATASSVFSYIECDGFFGAVSIIMFAILLILISTTPEENFKRGITAQQHNEHETPREMTIEQIEQELNYKVKVVK